MNISCDLCKIYLLKLSFLLSVLVEFQRIPYTKMLGIVPLPHRLRVGMRINHLPYLPGITGGSLRASRIPPYLTGL